MQARTFRDVGHFDNAVEQLRSYFSYLGRDAAARAARPAAPRRRTKKGRVR